MVVYLLDYFTYIYLKQIAIVIALAKGDSLQDLVYLGLVGICDPPKPFVRESIEQLYNCGVKVKLVTGDAQETAVAIGMLHTTLLTNKKHNILIFILQCYYRKYDWLGHDSWTDHVWSTN